MDPEQVGECGPQGRVPLRALEVEEAQAGARLGTTGSMVDEL